MDDDDTPVIRPVLPSRASAPPTPMWQEAGAVANERQAQDPQAFPLPSKPERTEPVKKSKKDPRRSAAAREVWKKRRTRSGGRIFDRVVEPSPASPDELGVLMQISALLEPLPATKRKVVLTILQGLVS